ncbi:MAG: peptide chain release factor N(5)-glutamine methyltransferase [Acidimicrobiales bacterium]
MVPRTAHSDGTAARADRRQWMLATAAGRLGSWREARWIIEHVEGETDGNAPRTDPDGFDSGPGPPSDEERTRRVEELVARRVLGEPLQYVLGRWPFRSLELKLDPRVLIPRPETEQVVEVALAELDRMKREMGSHAAHGGADAPVDPLEEVSPICVDLGTGSGAIALSLAVEGGRRFRRIEVWATDDSVDALAVAGENLADLAAEDPALRDRVQLTRGQWFDALPDGIRGRVDLLVSNPPYVSASEYDSLEPGIRDWEPPGALVAPMGTSGVDGMADIEQIVAGAPRWLGDGGTLIVEFSPPQAYAAIDVARRAGLTEVQTYRDLAGRLRMLVARHESR